MILFVLSWAIHYCTCFDKMLLLDINSYPFVFTKYEIDFLYQQVISFLKCRYFENLLKYFQFILVLMEITCVTDLIKSFPEVNELLMT